MIVYYYIYEHNDVICHSTFEQSYIQRSWIPYHTITNLQYKDKNTSQEQQRIKSTAI